MPADNKGACRTFPSLLPNSHVYSMTSDQLPVGGIDITLTTSLSSDKLKVDLNIFSFSSS